MEDPWHPNYPKDLPNKVGPRNVLHWTNGLNIATRRKKLTLRIGGWFPLDGGDIRVDEE